MFIGGPPLFLLFCSGSQFLALSILRLPAIRRLDQGEENDLFAGHGADVMMHAQHLDTRGLLDHFVHDRPRRFDQMSPIPPDTA